MKKAVLTLLAVAAFGALSANANALAIFGARSCGVWVEHRTRSDATQARASEAWLVGFLSGLVIATDTDALRDSENESIFL